MAQTDEPGDLPAGLGAPANRALAGAGIHNLRQLSAFDEKEIARLHGIGPKALRLLRKALDEKSLHYTSKAAPPHLRDEG